ncbi:hypothetical protein E2C01_014250 [Portunus trituberculatus]|uniref:Uncharacterized protein n=1 Tax=Portunus trituberculatus TaxID=210409 RepID=A0A5B7DJM0_PORTR|nr:hypothetical protein [Portunus trituberculatus]
MKSLSGPLLQDDKRQSPTAGQKDYEIILRVELVDKNGFGRDHTAHHQDAAGPVVPHEEDERMVHFEVLVPKSPHLVAAGVLGVGVVFARLPHLHHQPATQTPTSAQVFDSHHIATCVPKRVGFLTLHHFTIVEVNGEF